MRICYLAGAGSTGHAERWIRYFAHTGHEVHMITSAQSSGSYTDNMEVHVRKRFGPRIPIINSLANALPTIAQLKRLLRSINPDVVHAHAVETDALLGAFSGFHPFVVTPWGSDVLVAPKKSRLSRWKVKYVLKRADLITCDAEHIKEPLIALGADPQKIRVICFGVDIQKFKPELRDEKLREKLGIFDSPVVISSRRLDLDCDVVSLIDAVPRVLKEVPETKFVIIGRGSEELKLKELAESLGVSQNIHFVGWVSHSELPYYLASSDVHVSTALSDAGLAASTAEAMASGLPVIVTDFGDNRKWVEDGVNGFVTPLRAPDILANKIIYLLKYRDIGRKFGQLNRQIIEERNSWAKEMGKMGKLYEELVNAAVKKGS